MQNEPTADQDRRGQTSEHDKAATAWILIKRLNRSSCPGVVSRDTIRAMADTATSSSHPIAFPRLDATDLAALRPLASSCSFNDGEFVFHAGDADLDLFIVES